MSAIEITDVQTRIGEMLEAVERGETVDVLRDGTIVACLRPPSPDVDAQGTQPMPSLAEFRASLKINKECTTNSVVEMRDQERY